MISPLHPARRDATRMAVVIRVRIMKIYYAPVRASASYSSKSPG
jgi:hypothetical protein